LQKQLRDADKEIEKFKLNLRRAEKNISSTAARIMFAPSTDNFEKEEM